MPAQAIVAPQQKTLEDMQSLFMVPLPVDSRVMLLLLLAAGRFTGGEDYIFYGW